MQWTDRIRQVKILLVVAAVVIAVLSLVVSHLLTRDLSDEERSKMEVWSEAMRALNQADENTDLALVLKVIDQNHTIPVVVMGADGQAQFFRNVNVDGDNYEDSLRNAQQLGQQWLNNKQHIRIQLSDSTAGDYIDVCYDDSVMLRRLQTYPFVQLGVVMIFVVVAIFALLTSKRAEQNKVWVGLSKETAHQLGTPISSLMAWTEILKESYPDDDLIPEMDKDVKRLQLIADRFSKIGSLPEPVPASLNEVMNHVIDYMDRRTSKKVNIVKNFTEDDIIVSMNASLLVGNRKSMQKRRGCNVGRAGNNHAQYGTNRHKGHYRGERHGQRHTQEGHFKRVPPRFHHQEARLGTGTVARQAHRRGVSQRPYLREKLRTGPRHDLQD